MLREAARGQQAPDEQHGELEGFDETLQASVSDVVAKQKACGITIPNDGEYGKSMSGKVDYGAWWSYSFQRLGGLEICEGDLDVVPAQASRPGEVKLTNFANRRDWTEFEDAYKDPTAGIALGDTATRAFPVQVAPVHLYRAGPGAARHRQHESRDEGERC